MEDASPCLGRHANKLALDLLFDTADLDLHVAQLTLEGENPCLKSAMAVCIRTKAVELRLLEMELLEDGRLLALHPQGAARAPQANLLEVCAGAW